MVKIINNKNKEKGITLIALIITILILLLLAGVTAKISTSVIKIMKIENVRTNLLLIQAKIRIIHEKNTFDEEENKLVGEKIEGEEKRNEIKNKYGVDITKDDETQYDFYKISADDLNEMNLEEVPYDDGYIVNYETEEVIYIKGVQDEDGTTYYSLSQIKSRTGNQEEKNDNDKEDSGSENNDENKDENNE